MADKTTYEVIEMFRDSDGQLYFPGQSYPKQGMSIAPERLTLLTGTSNKIGKALIKAKANPNPAPKTAASIKE